MKQTLTEMENTLNGTPVELMKPRIKSAVWNIRKQKTASEYSKKKNNP